LSTQSAFLSFPSMSYLGPKSDDLFDAVFKQKYQSIMNATIFDNKGRNIWELFMVYCPSDQKFYWLACVTKGKTFFCQSVFHYHKQCYK
jgi:hypothetical protein